MADWREGYREAMKKFMVTAGQPMKMEGDAQAWGGPQPAYYGWTDFDALQHFWPRSQRWRTQDEPSDDPCTVVPAQDATIAEEHYHQFQGTFFTGDTRESFVVMHPVSCACGKYKDLYWGYSGTMGDIISGVLRDG